ncbi:MAG: hypothetical protein H7066_01005, partial [Cytophagaceae bacterium]|nr:hypothetical protein [Gemmatimonadaceae bacterium]
SLANNAMMVTAPWVLKVGLYSLGMLGVCLLACVLPTRRALKVEPTDALRGDA